MKNAVPKKGKEKEVKGMDTWKHDAVATDQAILEAASPEQSPEAAPPVVSVAGDTVLAVDGNVSIDHRRDINDTHRRS